MNRSRMRVAAGLTIVTAVSLAAGLPARSEQNPIDFELVFDGGYVYNLGAASFVEVKTLERGNHPLRIKLERGQWSLGGISDFRLHDADLEFWPDGAAPSQVKPGLPPNNARTDCDSALDRMNPNNLYFLPNLAEVANGMGTNMRRRPAPRRGSSLKLTGGGDLSIRSVSGCVEYRKPNNVDRYGNRRSMASGQGGVAYNWRLPSARNITLRVVSGGTTFNVVVTPVGNRIQLRIGDLATPGPMSGTAHKIDHFRSFDDAFSTIDEARRLSLWWVFGYEDSPGIDCPSGGDPEPWP